MEIIRLSVSLNLVNHGSNYNIKQIITSYDNQRKILLSFLIISLNMKILRINDENE